MLGQLGHFHKFAAGKTDTTYGVERYGAEVKRLLGVLDRRLEGREWLVDAFSIADIAIVPWLNGLDYYGAKELVAYDTFPNVVAWADRFNARPAVQRGVKVCSS
jgi:GST-like protein